MKRQRQRLTRDEYRRLVEVATRRLGGQTWQEVADAMGWADHSSPRRWALYNVVRWAGDPWLSSDVDVDMHPVLHETVQSTEGDHHDR